MHDTMKKDPLKDLFTETFANEEIVFNHAAWDAMNNLLHRNQRQRFLWIAITSFGSFGAICLMLLVFFQPFNKVYEPRNEASMRFSSLSIDIENKSLESLNKSNSHVLKRGGENNTTLQYAEQQTDFKSNHQKVKPVIAESSGDDIIVNPQTVVRQKSDDHNKVSPELMNPSFGELATTLAANYDGMKATRYAINKIDKIEWKPANRTGFNPENRVFTAPLDLSLESTFYIRLGGSKNFMIGTGQIGGLGYQKQIAPHILINAELNIARDYTYFNLVQTRIAYGFDQYRSALRIWANEMIHIENPLLIRFRYNRLSAATGLTLGLIWTSNVIEESLPANEVDPEHKRPVGNQESLGYVNWSEIRALQLALPLDVQYQLDERYFIGTRIQYGLRDAFTITPEMNRLNRFEFYFKMNLNP
jgi:hypothetical protein